MGPRRLPSPGFELRSEFDLSPQVGRGKGTRSCSVPPSPAPSPRRVFGSDDAVDDGHAECSHHIAISAARWPITSGCRDRTGLRLHRVRQTGRRAELGHLLSQRAPVRDPGPLGLMVSRGRSGRSQGASIAPPQNLREITEIVPSQRRALALIYFDRRPRPCGRDA